jgi:hypothetical protein
MQISIWLSNPIEHLVGTFFPLIPLILHAAFHLRGIRIEAGSFHKNFRDSNCASYFGLLQLFKELVAITAPGSLSSLF